MITKVLVTGSNGQLAKTIKDLFEKNEDALEFTFVNKKQFDITNTEEIENVLSKNEFHFCVNCAAYTNVEGAEDDEENAFKVNAEAVKNLAEGCKKHDVTLIHISTDYVFDGKANTPYLETDNTNPISVYGKSKLQGEQYIQQIMNNYFIVRTSWLYSYHGKNFLKTIISKAQENADLNIITSQKGTPTNCIDLSAFIYAIITTKSSAYGIYHYTGKGETTWYGFAKQIVKYFNNYDVSKLKPIKSFKTKAERPIYSVLNNSKALQIISKQDTWQESLDQTIKKYFI